MIAAIWTRARRRLRPVGLVLRRLLIALVVLVAVAAVFAVGIGVYAAAPKWQPLLLAWWPGLLPGVVTIVALGAWWLWWRLPKRQVDRLSAAITDVKARTDVEDNFRKTIGQLLGGAAVLIGAGAAYLQFMQQQQSARDLLTSNQVTKGFELLGKREKDDVTLRLGGIYALEGVMNSSDQYHRAVLDALCAFVRDGTKNEKGDGPLATDIQEALTVIGRRAEIGAEDLVALYDAHIPKAYLAGANLIGADLIRVNLKDANLNGAYLSRAILTGANLSGAMLHGANLSGAYLKDVDRSGAYLSIDDEVLRRAGLRSAEGLTQAQLDNACGKDVKLDPGLTIKPCPPDQPSAGSAK